MRDELIPQSTPDHDTKLTRRDLFRRAGFATGGALLLGVPGFLQGWTSEAQAALKPAYTTSTVALELDGIFAGFLTSVEGGNAFAEILAEPVGPDLIQRKRPGPVRFEDLIIEVPFDRDAKPLNDWITATLTANPVQHDGAIIFADFNLIEVKRLEFFNATLTEVTVPAADAADGKNPALLTLRLTPQTTRLAGGTGKKLSDRRLKSKAVLAGNFRLNVQNLEQACKRITKVSPISAKRALSGAPMGQEKFRQAPSAGGVLDCSKVSITLPEADAGPFYSWFDYTVVKGQPDAERSGLLEWLDPTSKTVLASVQLGGLGIVRYAPEAAEAGTEARGSVVQIEMYCETMNILI
jgi:hypothetical protein